jgi:pimeloyl-ACP methyl ester carboxylesterase
MSEDVRAFMDAMGLPAAVIVGHSMGASVAQRFAIDHAARVLGLVLVGSFASLHRDPGLTQFYVSSIAGLRDPIDPGFARAWQLSTLARDMPADRLDIVVGETCKVPSYVWRAAFAGFLGTQDFTADLHRVSAPAMIVWGDRDTYASREAQDRLLAALPGARLVVYKGAGHALHWEEPARFAGDLSAFVERARLSTAVA